MSAYIDVIGNLTHDPELSTNDNGTTMCDISVAAESQSRDRNNNTKTVYFRTRIFGRHGQACGQYLKKGSKVCIRGEFFPVEYKGRDGQDKVLYTINNPSVEFISTGNRQSQAQPTVEYRKNTSNNEDLGGEDELPF